MSKHHIKIVNNSNSVESGVNPSIIKILYDYTDKTEKGLQVWDAMDPDKINSSLCGNIYLKYIYDKHLNKLNDHFYNTLIINANKQYVFFEDSNVENEMIRMFGDSDGGVTVASVNITSFSNEFQKNQMINKYGEDNWQIRSFNELSKFPQITKLANGVGWTFSDQNLLESIDLKYITSVGTNCFLRCASLTNLGDTSNITTIGNYAFNGCTSLVSFNLSSLVTVLSQGAFCNCASLKNIDISHVQTIQSEAFKGCSSLESIDLSALISIGNSAFQNCTALKPFNLPQSIVSIEQSTFENCTSLNTIDISKIKTIGSYAFKGCSSLTSVDLSECTSIGNSAFENCTSLITASSLSTCLSLSDNTFKNCALLNNINISNIKLIKQSVFENCTSLSNITLSEELMSIANNAFYNCTSLINITLPETLTSLGAAVFKNCTSLQSINIPSEITTLNSSLFDGCTSLSSLTIDWSKITQISSNILIRCTELGENETIDVNLSNQTRYPNQAFGYTKYKKLIVHMYITDGASFDGRYPLHECMDKLEYLDYSDTNIGIWSPLYLSKSFEDDGVTRFGPMKTIIMPSTTANVDWRWQQQMPRLEHMILLVENPSQFNLTGSGATALNGGEGRVPLSCNIYVKDATVRAAYLAHEFWGTIPNASTRIKTLSELPTGVWTTGLYQQYEPYLSNH